MQMNAVLASAILGFGMVIIVDGAPVAGGNTTDTAPLPPFIVTGTATGSGGFFDSFTRDYVQDVGTTTSRLSRKYIHHATRTEAMAATKVQNTDFPFVTDIDPYPGLPWEGPGYPGPPTVTTACVTKDSGLILCQAQPVTYTDTREPILTTITTDTVKFTQDPPIMLYTTVTETVDPPAATPTTLSSVLKDGRIGMKPIPVETAPGLY